MRIPSRAWMAAALGVLVGAAATPIVGQQAGAGQDTLTALLVEVRGLRAAMEQMAAAGPRVQLAMGRLQLQEQRINTMARQLEAVRERKAGAEREAAEMRDRANRLQEAAERSEDGKERKAAEMQAVELKRVVERMAVDLQRLAGDETELANAVAVEQSRWSDINRRLEELEASLLRQR